MMELSRASNCPSIAYQLVGMKKIQQILTEEGMLERLYNSYNESQFFTVYIQILY